MQCGVDVSTYKRIDNKKVKREININNTIIKHIIMAGVAFLLSRVMLSIISGSELAPFGIAYLLGVSIKNKHKDSFVALLGTIFGYLSMYNYVDDIIVYIFSALMIFVYIEIKKKITGKTSARGALISVFIIFLLYNAIIVNQPLEINITISIIKVIVIVPIYYILKYAINCMEELNTNYFFSTEELISIGILICLLAVGIGNISVFNISIRSVVALALVISVAYVGGVGFGAAMGVTMGFIMGINSNNVIGLISIYSLCGLIVGVFKDTGRFFSVISYLVMYYTMTMYSGVFTIYGGVEAVIAAAILLLVPVKFIEQMFKEVNQDKKAEIINSVHIEGIKMEFTERIDELKNVLSSVALAISDLSENDRLLLRNKGDAMVGSLADRVCNNCELRGRCWDRNLHNTFSSFSELITSCEENEIIFPRELEKRCVKKNSLIRSTQELINNYIVNEALKSRLAEGRNLIVNHVNNMSLTIGDIVRDFNKDISTCTDIDRILRKALNKNNIKYNDIFCYLDKKGRLKIKITLTDCGGANYCSKGIIPIINNELNIPLSINNYGCRINPNTGECSIVVEETPKYHVTSYVKSLVKDGERFAGDSYSFGKSDDGTYLTMISDGMGSGPEAGIESKVAVELIEKFIGAGFSNRTAINTVNSVMAMKFSEDEKFATLDLSVIDLYTGETDFIKVGGVASFIKRGKEVEVIKSKSLPFGILDNVDVDIERKTLKHGDIIVTISDGVLDIDKNNIGDFKWIEEYLAHSDSNPEALSRDIIDKARSLMGGRIFDDMTVVVSKIYSVY